MINSKFKYFLIIFAAPSLVAMIFGQVGVKVPAAILGIGLLLIYGVLKEDFGWISVKNLDKIIYIVSILVLFCLSFLWSPSMVNKIEKIWLIVYTIIFPLVALLFLGRKNKEISSMDAMFVIRVVLMFFCVFYIIFSQKEPEGNRFILAGIDNPIAISRFLAFFLLIYLMILKDQKIVLLDYILLIIAMYCILLAGSKGPFLAAVASFFYWNNTNIKKNIIIFIYSILVIFVMKLLLPESYLFDFDFYSAAYRMEAIDFASSIEMKVFGYGFGSFDLYFFGNDGPGYPHNIFAEIYFESGLFGLVVFISYLYVVFSSKKSDNFFMAIFIYWFINSLFSGDLPGNSGVFITGYMILIGMKYEKRNTNLRSERNHVF